MIHLPLLPALFRAGWSAAGQSGENTIIDAIGPETYTFNQLVATMARALNSRAKIIHLPPGVALLMSRVIGLYLRDVVLTADEVRGLMENYLVTNSPPVGQTSLDTWMHSNIDHLGKQYASELSRHYRSETVVP